MNCEYIWFSWAEFIYDPLQKEREFIYDALEYYMMVMWISFILDIHIAPVKFLPDSIAPLSLTPYKSVEPILARIKALGTVAGELQHKFVRSVPFNE